ncbi:hypothetical protein FA95DRAFT_1610352 [Auriscalpium vulgare]|uniref:Uncharacterized protein n=1 Tax=Auriscalpium vulgare TaxID=40419 RepID=A0ACB8RF49_9AGAM|nr:hypothetical protein FA95DRAFT_1610352 [Auriscalpium vulgare]
MSAYFPDVDLPALKRFAVAAAAAEHASRMSRNAPVGAGGGGAKKTAKGKGKGKGRLQEKPLQYPSVVGCEDTVWAGEEMIMITFDPQSVPLGPHCMVAHFPRGRPTFATKALVGMTQVVRESAQIAAPKIYGYYDNVPNPINAEVVLLEMVGLHMHSIARVPGESLEDVWIDLKPRQIMMVCARLGELLVKLFNCRSQLLCSETNVPDSPPRPAAESSSYRRQVLLTRPFDEGPLATMEPQEALTSTHDYLLALSKRPERVFGDPNSPAHEEGRDTGWIDHPRLSDADIVLLRDTWNRLGSLIPYHSGGFYIPGALSPDARYTAYTVLQSKEYGVRHTDMQMARFLVRWERPGDERSDCTLALTGWEHAARAPLWSAARMPPWLAPHVHPFEQLTWEGQRNVRQFVFHSVFHGDLVPQARAWEWVVAYVYGATERWFEGLLSAHWGFRDTAEVLLVRLREHWERERPDVPFHLDVGGAYLSGVGADRGVEWQTGTARYGEARAARDAVKIEAVMPGGLSEEMAWPLPDMQQGTYDDVD